MEVTFVGICSIDLYSNCHRLPNIGETIHGIALNRGFGGKSSNACAQFAFLSDESLKPNLLTCVGNDSDGAEIEKHFREIGISTQLVQHSTTVPTGLAICFVLDGGESAIVIHPCPVTSEMVAGAKDKLKNSKYVVTNFEIPVDVASETLRIAKEAGAKTILNCSPIPEKVDISLFKNASIVIVNEVELKAIGTIEELFAQGVECVVNTCGADGAIVHTPGNAPIKVPSPKVKAIDTTGAGDSFLGSFAYCLARGSDYEAAARFACVCASISVQGIGTQGSYAHRDHEQLKDILPK